MQEMLSGHELKTIFANIEDLLVYNTQLLSDLEDRQSHSEYIISAIGDIFLKHVSITSYGRCRQ